VRRGKGLSLRDANWARAEQGPPCWLSQVTWPQPRPEFSSQYRLDRVVERSREACWRCDTFATGAGEGKRDFWTGLGNSRWRAMSCRSGLRWPCVYLQAVEACLLGTTDDCVCGGEHAGHKACDLLSAGQILRLKMAQLSKAKRFKLQTWPMT
jgi:hypothetical protein